MATDLSLRRLRELLRLSCASCEAASKVVDDILNGFPFHAPIDKWWKENYRKIVYALGRGLDVGTQMENAATLCEQDFSGDAEQLRKTRAELVQQVTYINEFYHSTQDATPAPDWPTIQHDLWFKLSLRLSAADNAARSLLKSQSIKGEQHPIEQHEAAAQPGAELGEHLPANVQAQLVGDVPPLDKTASTVLIQQPTYLISQLRALSGVSNDTLNKYAGLANPELPIAKRGQKNFRRTYADAIKLFETMKSQASHESERNAARIALEKLAADNPANIAAKIET